MFDLSQLQYSSEYPGLISMVFTVLCSVMLGILLAFTYEKTSKDIERPDHFLQAIILVTIVAGMIMQAIGDSVARGLGMIGALSIIRFRTTLRNPRNIVFMFGAIAIGIACGVFGYLIAIVGTIGFCLTAFLLKYSAFGTKEKHIGKFKISASRLENNSGAIRKVISSHSIKNKLLKTTVGIGLKADNLSYSYIADFVNIEDCYKMIDDLDKIENVRISSVTFENSQFDNI